MDEQGFFFCKIPIASLRMNIVYFTPHLNSFLLVSLQLSSVFDVILVLNTTYY